MAEARDTLIPYQSPSAEAPFRALKSGCTWFGVIAIILGACAGLMGMLAPIAALAPQLNGGSAPQRLGDVVAGALLYLALSITLIWIGSGAIRMRRWVRPLVLTLGTLALLIGIYVLFMMAVMFPTLLKAASAGQATTAPAVSPAFIALGMVISFFFLAVLMVMVPAAFVWFYRKPSVAAMLDYFDPTPRWTDQCPIQVLGFVVALVVYAVGNLVSAPAAVTPVFGTVLTKLPAVGVELAEALIALMLARLLFRLRRAGWWGTLAFMAALAVFHGMSSFRLDQAGLYRRAGFSEQQLAGMGALQPTSRLELIVGWLPILSVEFGYLFYVRKFFSASAQDLTQRMKGFAP